MTVDTPYRNPFSGPVHVALAEADPARRVALNALIRQSRHLELVAALRDDQALLEWLATDRRADVLMAGPALRAHRVDRYELFARAREQRPDLPILYAMANELPGAVRRAHGHA